MTKTKKILSIILSLVMMISCFSITAFSASAANYTTNYKNYSTPGSSDYAYWNGKKTVRAGSTTTSKVKWMQAALNYCISYRGLNASKLDVEGSFGPACKKTTLAFQKKYSLKQDGSFGPGTISKMKSVLSSTTNNNSGGKITTTMINDTLNKYGYKNNTYWTYKSGGSATSGYYATSRKGRSYSYRYNGVECYGFANFVMHEVTNTAVNPNNGNKNGWKYLKPSDVTSLKVGDIVRIGNSNSNGHSGVVLTVDSNGNCTFAQCLGGCDNRISIGKGLSSSKFGNHTTLKTMKSKSVLLYVYRYVG